MPVVRYVIVPLVIALAGCPRPSPSPVPDASVVAVDAAVAMQDAALADAAPAARAALDAPWQVELTDGAARLGFLSVPVGAREPRPVVLALHGGADRPDWACNEWRGITDGYAFIVCPRGPGQSDTGLAWSALPDTKARVARAMVAAKKMYSAWMREDTPIVLVGFSMGATQAALLARSDPKTHPRVVLAESAYAPEAAMTFAEPWAHGGGERAIFSCTTGGCEGPYRKAARHAALQGAKSRLNIAGTNEHGMWEQVLRSMRRDWPWLVEGLNGWEGYAPIAPDSPLPGKTESFDSP